MPKPTKLFIQKVSKNQRHARRLMYYGHLSKNCDPLTPWGRAKVCHSLIHNLVEAYEKYDKTELGRTMINEIRQDIIECL